MKYALTGACVAVTAAAFWVTGPHDALPWCVGFVCVYIVIFAGADLSPKGDGFDIHDDFQK